MKVVLRPAKNPPTLDEFCFLSHDAQRVMAAMYADYNQKKKELEEAKRSVFDPKSYYQSIYQARFGQVSNQSNERTAEQTHNLESPNDRLNTTNNGNLYVTPCGKFPEARTTMTNSSVSRRIMFGQNSPGLDHHLSRHTKRPMEIHHIFPYKQFCNNANENRNPYINRRDHMTNMSTDLVTLDGFRLSEMRHWLDSDKNKQGSVSRDQSSMASDSPPIETQDYHLLSQMHSSQDTINSSPDISPRMDTPHTTSNQLSATKPVQPSSPVLFSQESVFSKPSKPPCRVKKNPSLYHLSKDRQNSYGAISNNDNIVGQNRDFENSPDTLSREKQTRTNSDNFDKETVQRNKDMNEQLTSDKGCMLSISSLNEHAVPVSQNGKFDLFDNPNFDICCDDLSVVFNPTTHQAKTSLAISFETHQLSEHCKQSKILKNDILNRKTVGTSDHGKSIHSNIIINTVSAENDDDDDGLNITSLNIQPAAQQHNMNKIKSAADLKKIRSALSSVANATPFKEDTTSMRSSVMRKDINGEENPFPANEGPLFPIFSKKKKICLKESPLMEESTVQGKKRTSVEKVFAVPFKKQKKPVGRNEMSHTQKAVEIELTYLETQSAGNVADILDQLLKCEELVLTAVYSDKSTQLRDTLFGTDSKKKGSNRGSLPLCQITNIAVLCPQKKDSTVYMLPAGSQTSTHYHMFKKFWSTLFRSKIRKVGFQVKNIVKEVIKSYSFDHNKADTCWSLLDTMVAAWLLNPDHPVFTFHDLLKSLNMPEQTGSEHSLKALGDDMMLLSCAMSVLYTRLTSKNLWDLYLYVESRLLPLLAAMEMRQLSIATHTLLNFSEILKMKLTKLEQEAHKSAGHTFLLSSHAQLRQVLCEELQLNSKLPRFTKLAKTSVGQEMSTSETVLTQLSPFHPLPSIILEYRQLLKLKSTYIDGLLSCVKNEGLTTHWDQTAAATGRLTSHHPNIQAIPKLPVTLSGYSSSYIVDKPDNDEVTIYARDAFISPPGWSLLAADFQQIELRLLGHLTEDPVLLDLFSKPDVPDVFNALTAQWLCKPVEAVTVSEREQTKRVVYSVMYGAGKEKLAEYLKISAENAKAVIDSFLLKFPAVSQFTKSCVEFCRKNGYTCSVFHRRRLFPHIHHKSPALRAQAERQCVNFRVQGSAADLCKAAMLQIEEALYKQPCLQARMLVQIHDELLLEVLDSDLTQVADVVRSVMENGEKLCGSIVKLRVPIPVSISTGKTWGHMEPLLASVTKMSCHTPQ